MACKFYIGTESKIDPKGGKSAKSATKKTCQIRLILVILSAHVKRVSVSRMRDFFDVFLRFLPNLRHVDNLKPI